MPAPASSHNSRNARFDYNLLPVYVNLDNNRRNMATIKLANVLWNWSTWCLL